jgi:hypothetical protein
VPMHDSTVSMEWVRSSFWVGQRTRQS